MDNASLVNPLPDLNFAPRLIESLRNLSQWYSGDYQVCFHKNSEGWYLRPQNDNFNTAMLKVGLDFQEPPTTFPTLKEAQKSALSIALDSGFTLSSKLKKPRLSIYEVGVLPLNIIRKFSQPWNINLGANHQIPIELVCFFPNRIKDFNEMCLEASLYSKQFVSRAQAIATIKDCLEEHIQKFMLDN
jgi:hypothetical protein